jgi:hypothetical protein
MDSHLSRLASRVARFVPAAAAVLLLAGCDVKIIDRTPPTFEENPSQVYTITAEVRVSTGVLKSGTLQPSVVIDGQSQAMRPSPLGKRFFEYDYKMPPGRTAAKYYLLASFETEANGRVNQRETFTGLKEFKVVGRYGLSLDAARAPVGAQVSVLGRGFTQQDVVYVGQQAAQTSWLSSNTLRFTVPPVAAGKNYPVNVGAPGGGLPVGTLRIDEGTLSVAPGGIVIASGERQMLVFSIPSGAPPGGLTLDVTTDVPASVIMPVVVVPADQRSVSVPVQGGQPGSGTIFVTAPGFGEVRVPVTVNPR